ncbi:MAG: type I-A CRISPR-associated protein Cas4/Csa1 [Methanothermobacter sp.]|nr:type I-A CRISPR-associated protein Cas4/Csa1 [Methanothermobacter sp.]
MYFLSDIEQKLLINKQILARKVGVSEELRGWNWSNPPLNPYYSEVYIPMYLACSKYCPKNRDIFVEEVLGKKGIINFNVMQGIVIHRAVCDVFENFVERKKLDFDKWWHLNYKDQVPESYSKIIKNRTKIVWEYTKDSCKSVFLNRLFEQPYASKRDVLATSLPFLTEHKLNGNFLGLSDILSVDCYDYLHNIVFDIKVASKQRKWFKLYPTGYALVIESIYEIPVDIGCTVYISFIGEKLNIKKDIFFINDDLRSWWVEERDKKLEIVAQKKDPGMPQKCPDSCIYLHECR